LFLRHLGEVLGLQAASKVQHEESSPRQLGEQQANTNSTNRWTCYKLFLFSRSFIKRRRPSIPCWLL